MELNKNQSHKSWKLLSYSQSAVGTSESWKEEGTNFSRKEMYPIWDVRIAFGGTAE